MAIEPRGLLVAAADCRFALMPLDFLIEGFFRQVEHFLDLFDHGLRGPRRPR
jgi:hypothetical protein